MKFKLILISVITISMLFLTSCLSITVNTHVKTVDKGLEKYNKSSEESMLGGPDGGKKNQYR